MKTEIIFIINSIQNPRCVKRVNEFIANGYDVKVYAFNRGGTILNNNVHFKINFLKAYSNDLSYIKRIPILFNCIKKIIKENEKDSIYYLFGLEISMMFACITKATKFIYEESDLMHTYLSKKILQNVFERIDKYIIRKSLITVFTSDGFRRYHFGNKCPKNCYLIPNRLSPEIKQYELIPKVKSEKLRIGFVGHIRFKTVKSFAEIFCENYPNFEFHFYGDLASEKERAMFLTLNKYPNCYFHGAFKTPIDLPEIYSHIDLVLSTYDINFDNVRYAEPNKIYESIYFETPIIVSDGCFLGDKVKKMNIGFTVNALDPIEVKRLIDSINTKIMNNRIISMRKLGKEYAINNNDGFFVKLKEYI